jgi:hypothetical protein
MPELDYDYDVTLATAPDGSFTGRAVSRQELSGCVPGLAGSRPRVRVAGETIRVESDPSERPPANWTYWLLALVPVVWISPPFFINRWRDRQRRSAQVRAFDLLVPGILSQLRSGVTLRICQNAQIAKQLAEVTLGNGQIPLATWTPQEISRVPW